MKIRKDGRIKIIWIVFFSNKKEMAKKLVLIIVILISGLIVLSVFLSRMSSPPNVVLIIIDTLRADKLGCYGYPENVSPEIDQIAGKGVQFKKVIAQCTWTRPSIGSMLTGLYPRTLGLYKEKFDILNDRYLTLAEILKENGYTTIGITANPNINSVFNFNQGFDYYIDSNVVWKWMRELTSEEKKVLLDPLNAPLPTAQEIFQKTVDSAKSLMKGPFYVQINIMEVHERKRLHSEELIKSFNNLYDDDDIVRYYNAIRQVSNDIGQFIERLITIPRWENTLFVITSDHGEGLKDHPDVWKSESHGRLLYESQVYVPMIWYHPRPKESKTKRWIRELFPRKFYHLTSKKIETPVRLLDMMPTLLDYLKIPLPDHLHGKSLIKHFYEEEAEVGLPQYFVVESYFRGTDKKAVYSDKWKYIENHDGHEGVNMFELQPMGIKENGKATDKINEEPLISRKLKEYLVAWEKKYPKVEVTPPSQQLSSEEIKQLKSLGYLN